MLKIAICDDQIIFRDDLNRKISKYFNSKNLAYSIVEFSLGKELLESSQEINILFLDIGLEDIDGISLKNQISHSRKATYIIFLTSHIERMQEAFGLKVIDFFVKPLQEVRLFQTLDQIISELQEVIYINIEKGREYIKSNEIWYINSADKYSEVYLENKRYLVRKTLSEWEVLLKNYSFCRVHKTTIINFAFVKRIEKKVVMDDNTKLDISVRKIKFVKENYYDYIRRKLR